ncbi:hypothetical protein, partial [Salinibacter ruber]|uniref:hypothetical protein n=1 Tax=Salinibacter ruber TaxID=146919 RepID=UPI002073D0DE
MQVSHRYIIGVLVLGLLPVSAGWAQKGGVAGDTSAAWHADAWTPIIEKKGLRISYIGSGSTSSESFCLNCVASGPPAWSIR